MPFRAVFFDFDGTLADSFEAITASTNHVRSSFGLPGLPESVVRECVGFGLPNLMEHLVPGFDTNEAVARYRQHHPLVMFTGTRLMRGVAETLPILHQRGFKLGVCSNKQVQFTKTLIESLGLGRFIELVLGPEDVFGRVKPDPAMLMEAVARLGLQRDEVVYVGDMAIDVHTAQAAKIRVWLVPGGATGRESAAAACPDRELTQFGELLDLLPDLSAH